MVGRLARDGAARRSRVTHPDVAPHEWHFRQVPLRTMVMAPHSGQLSPS